MIKKRVLQYCGTYPEITTEVLPFLTFWCFGTFGTAPLAVAIKLNQSVGIVEISEIDGFIMLSVYFDLGIVSGIPHLTILDAHQHVYIWALKC